MILTLVFIPTEDLVQNAISKYRNHPSVVNYKEKKKNLSGEIFFLSGTI